MRIGDQGSIVLFTPETDEEKTWIDENVDPDAQWLGRSLVVEHRYADDLTAGMASDGISTRAA
jgi:hypothetical protein